MTCTAAFFIRCLARPSGSARAGISSSWTICEFFSQFSRL
nr:MAG TPA: hypothetical protein [Caudoviricetes sp.]